MNLKVVDFSEFQNIISDSPPPHPPNHPNVIMTQYVQKSICDSTLKTMVLREGLRGDKIPKTVSSVGLKFLGFHFLSIANNFPNLHSSVATVTVVIDFLSMEPGISLQTWFCLLLFLKRCLILWLRPVLKPQKSVG